MPRPDLESPLSQLTIRAADPLAGCPVRWPARWLGRLVHWLQGAGHTGDQRAPRPALSVSVSDIHGRQVWAEANAGASSTLTLPPGTYHVLIRTQGAERRYTLALAPRQTAELQLRRAID